ncbi:MAG TPA: gluconeogenesis factor YvcK family protein [Fimbriimonadaceae bacterium]|nr:gluconeogenesis factor YvcK family protein [Fimbriimonadaceae bacterium]
MGYDPRCPANCVLIASGLQTCSPWCSDAGLPHDNDAQVSGALVCIGGRTGMSALLSGLKSFGLEPWAITGVFDNGSSTGELSRSLLIPGIGDAAGCLAALSAVADLANYRFPAGPWAGHPVKNVLAAASVLRNGGDLQKGLDDLASLLQAQGRVIVAALEAAELVATTSLGTRVLGESLIGATSDLVSVELTPPVVAAPLAIDVVKGAKALVIAPGSLFTSVTASLLPKGISEAIRTSQAPMIGVVNLTTEQFETTGVSADEHVDFIEGFVGRKADLWIADTSSWAQLNGEDAGPGRVFIRPRRHAGRCLFADVRPDDRSPVHSPEKLARAVAAALAKVVEARRHVA